MMSRTSRGTSRPQRWRWGIASGAALLLAGCASRVWQGFPTEVNPKYVWPPPPEAPRVSFVQSISNHEDLFKIGGFLTGVVRLVAGPADSRMAKPYALAVHPEGGLLVTDPGRGLVHFYDWTHRRYVAIRGGPEGRLPSPVGVAVLPGGEFLVSESRGGTVERFSAKGKWLGPFAAKGVLSRPVGVAVDPERQAVYVADVTNHRIAVFGFDGTLQRTFGERGGGPGQFNFPTHLALGPDGRLIVTDSMNFRVEIIQPDGTFVREIGTLGDAPGQFSKPKGVAVDSEGDVIVVEGLYDSVEFFDSGGRLLLNLGSSGADPGQFWLPGGLAFDKKNSLLFVADSHNARVQVFRMLPPTASTPDALPESGEGKGRVNTP